MSEEYYEDTQRDQFAGYVAGDDYQSGLGFSNEQLGFIDAILKKDELEKIIPKKFSLMFRLVVKNLALSNYSKDDVIDVVNQIDYMRSMMVMQHPPGWWTWRDEEHYQMIRTLARSEALRGLDGRERKLLATSINQVQQDVNYRQPSDNRASGGMAARFSGAFRRRR